MMAAPMAAKPITSAITCRCRDARSKRIASPPPTPRSWPADAKSLVDGLAALDGHDQRDAHAQDRRADQQQVVGADLLDGERRERRAHRAAEAGAAADEAEQPLRLPRVVDVVGERPELADQQNAEDQAET